MKRLALLLLLIFAAAPAAPAAAAEDRPPAAAAVRVGEHPGFSRIVLDFAALPAYSHAQAGNRLELLFGEPVALALPVAETTALARVAAASWAPGERRLALTLEPGTTARVWESEGHKIVIDLYPASPDAPDGRVAVADGRGVDPPASAAQPAAAQPSQAAADAGETAAASPPAPSSAPAAVAAALSPAAGPELAIAFTRDPEGFALVLRLPDDLGLAAFRRGNRLWIVVERPLMVAIDHAGPAAADAGQLIGPLTRLDATGATILHAEMREIRDLSVSRRGGRWYVYLKDTTTIPRKPLETRVDRSEGLARLFLPAADPGARVDFTDPLLGDRLIVVPLAGDGEGVMETRSYPQFALLKSAQGVVVQPFDDALRVRRFANGVAIEADGGLDLSPEMLARATADGERPRRLIDLAAWRGDGTKPFAASESALLVRLSLASAADRTAARWDLARFYLGHHLAPDAAAMLQLLADGNEALAGEPAFRAAQGIALLWLHRPQAALERLLDPRLDPEMEVWLWRALAYESLGMNEDAAAAYLKGREALHEQDPEIATGMRLAAVRAFLALKDWDRAEDEIEQLQALPLGPRARVEVALRRAQLLEGRGDAAAAIAVYADVAAARDRRLSVEARYALARLRLAAGDITRAQAIEELERLRYAWRGDSLEIRILDTLGELYRDDGRAREALDVWSIAAANFPNDPEVRAINRKMLALFRHLFLDGAADAMPAVEALGLFYDFRELTPLGADGDRMIRRLARRLVKLGLYSRAAELLEHQVRFRLEGAAQAAVAVPLAAVHLLDNQPQKAVDILRATRTDALPAPLIAERRRIESQALAALGRADEAAALLERASDREGILLRAHYYWQAQDWDRLIATLAPLYVGPPAGGLSEAERRGLLEYALALSLKDDRAALARLRRDFSQAMGKDAIAGLFDLLTAPESPGARDLATLNRIMDQIGSFSPTSEGALRAKVLAALADRALSGGDAPAAPAGPAAANPS